MNDVNLAKVMKELDKIQLGSNRNTYYTIDENNVVTIYDEDTDGALYMMSLEDFEEFRKFNK